MQRLRKRINDRKILSLIWKCLRAGIMEQGSFRHSVLGTPQGGILTPPTILQTFFFRAGITWAWLDPEPHLHLVIGHRHALDQRADPRSCPAPLRLYQPLLALCRNVFQATNHQAPVSVQGVLLGQLLALRFHRGDPLAEPGDPGRKLLRVNQRLGVTVNQPRQALSPLAPLRVEGGAERARGGPWGCARRWSSSASRLGGASSAQTSGHTASSNRSVRT